MWVQTAVNKNELNIVKLVSDTHPFIPFLKNVHKESDFSRSSRP